MSYSYRVLGGRFVRKYVAARSQPVYMTESQAQDIVANLCTVPFERSKTVNAMIAYHTDDVVDEQSGTTGFDQNVKIQGSFDASAFCAGHVAGMHRAYATACVYVYKVPSSAVGTTLESITLNVVSDPYNAQGVRLHVMTNSDGTIPMGCHELRGEDSSGVIIEDGTTASGVAVRTARTVGGVEYWYPTNEKVKITPTNGLELSEYLLVAVLKESYSAVRGNWIEGSSYIENDCTIELDDECSELDSNELNDLSEGSLQYCVKTLHVYNQNSIPYESGSSVGIANIFRDENDNIEIVPCGHVINGREVLCAIGNLKTNSSTDIKGFAVYAVEGSNSSILMFGGLSTILPKLQEMINAGIVKIVGVNMFKASSGSGDGRRFAILKTNKPISNPWNAAFWFDVDSNFSVSGVEAFVESSNIAIALDAENVASEPGGSLVNDEVPLSVVATNRELWTAFTDGKRVRTWTAGFPLHKIISSTDVDGLGYDFINHSINSSGADENINNHRAISVVVRASSTISYYTYPITGYETRKIDVSCQPGIFILAFYTSASYIPVNIPFTLDNYEDIKTHCYYAQSGSESGDDSTIHVRISLSGKFTKINGMDVKSGVCVIDATATYTPGESPYYINTQTGYEIKNILPICIPSDSKLSGDVYVINNPSATNTFDIIIPTVKTKI